MNEHIERAVLISEIRLMFGLISQFGVIEKDTSLYRVRRIHTAQTEALKILKGEVDE